MTRRRLDLEMVRRGMVESREAARTAVAAGLVTVGGQTADKPARMVGEDEALNLIGEARRFVSRGGEKLDAALERFPVDPSGRDCLDAGASTGGFTDVLLRRGAARVCALDVGYGQLAWSLRTDERVSVLERTNARTLAAGALPFTPSIVVADLSFISLASVIPGLVKVAAPDADLVLLVKPQFELDPSSVGKGGVVRDPDAWRRACRSVVEACRAVYAAPRDLMPSPITGPKGNVEFLLHAKVGGAERELPLDAVIEQASAIGGAA